jgi:hypothetical protein
MSIYRIHFRWKEKEIQLKASSLDLSHPCFVSIKDIIFPKAGRLIIDPSEDEIRKNFSDTINLMIPVNTVILIEEIKENCPPEKTSRFTVIEGSGEKKE